MADSRKTVIAEIIVALKEISGSMKFNLVKPYQGELDRYRKIEQIKSDSFPAEVNLASPFALVISKDRENIGRHRQNRNMKLEHFISIYIGVSNAHDLMSEAIPTAYDYLDACVAKLHAKLPKLTLVNDGIYLCRTDLYFVYDQQWTNSEIPY